MESLVILAAVAPGAEPGVSRSWELHGPGAWLGEGREQGQAVPPPHLPTTLLGPLPTGPRFQGGSGHPPAGPRALQT